MVPMDIGFMELNKDLMDDTPRKKELKKKLKIKPSCLKLIYDEAHDYLISGYEDSRISKYKNTIFLFFLHINKQTIYIYFYSIIYIFIYYLYIFYSIIYLLFFLFIYHYNL